MANEDPDLHEKIVSSPEARERLLAEALAHAEHQDARYRLPVTEREPGSRGKGALSVVVFALAAYIALAPPNWLTGGPPASVSTTDLTRGTHAALRLQALQIEVFQLRTGEIPRDLSELPDAVPGVRFVRSNNRVYQLVAAGPDGEAIVFDSARPTPAFDGFVELWTGMPGS